jgi:hypothetical protein
MPKLYIFNASATGYYINLNQQDPPAQSWVAGVTQSANWSPNQPMSGTNVVTYGFNPGSNQPTAGVLVGGTNTLILEPKGINPPPPVSITVSPNLDPSADVQLYLFWAGNQTAASYVLLTNGTKVVAGNLNLSA